MTTNPKPEFAIGGDIISDLEKLKRGKLPPTPPTDRTNPLIAPAVILAVALVVAAGIVAAVFGRYSVSSHAIGPLPSVTILDRFTGIVRHCDLGQQECVILRGRQQEPALTQQQKSDIEWLYRFTDRLKRPETGP